MKKTVFIGVSLGDVATSTSDYFINIADEFVSQDYQVVLFTDKQRKDLVCREGDVHILTWPSRRPTSFVDAMFFMKEIKHYKPSVLIANFGSVNMMTTMGFLLRIPIRLAWVRTLSTQLETPSLVKKLRKKMVYKFATGIIANSKVMKDDVVNNYHIAKEKVKVFPNAVTMYKQKNIVKNPNKLVYIGRLHKTKGVDILIKAFDEVVKMYANLHLDIIGSGEEREFLDSLVKELKLETNISFLGSVSKEKVLEHFQEATIAIVPSRSEAFGYVVIEAMSVKTAVIGSRVGGIKEIITDKKDGLLFESENFQELALHIKKLIENPQYCEEIALKGYETIQERYDSKKIAINFVNFVGKL